MDAPSRGSCTQKIPRTLANGELTMYSYAIEVSSVDRGALSSHDMDSMKACDAPLLICESRLPRHRVGGPCH